MYWLPNPNLYKPWLRNKIREGRGIGQGPPYTGWFNVRDFPSRGNSHVYRGIKIDRLFQLCSDLEAIRFLQLERDHAVSDIREGFPIFDIDWTMDACVMLHIRHSCEDGFPSPFTLDFVVTRRTKDEPPEVAESIKTPVDATKEDVKLRLSVESNWCRKRAKIPYVLIDTAPYLKTPYSTKELLSALEFMRAWFLERYEPDLQRELRFERAFSTAYEKIRPSRS